MNLKEQNILFLARAMHIGGTEKVILQLCEIFAPLANKVIVCSYGGESVSLLDEMGIKHYDIPDMHNKSLKTIKKTAKKIRAIVKEEHITVIHTHCRMAAFYVRILNLHEHCFFINTSHTVFLDKKVLTRYAYKNAHCIACGEMVRKNLHDFYGIDNAEVIHNAVRSYEGNQEEDPLLAELKYRNNFLIGNVSRLSEEKGVKYFIYAAHKVLLKYENTKFIIVGTGKEEKILRQLCKELGIEEAVLFMGYRTDVQNLIRQMDLMVLSSLMEGLPLTPIETFSVGKSIVATAVDGTVEIVRDGIDGYLVEPENPDAISEKIIYLIEHPEIRAHFETKAKERFDEAFSFEGFRKKYIDFYTKL